MMRTQANMSTCVQLVMLSHSIKNSSRNTLFTYYIHYKVQFFVHFELYSGELRDNLYVKYD